MRINRMDTIKAPAKKIKEICKTVPSSAFNTLIRTNVQAGRSNQWKNVKNQFTSNCDRASTVVLSPNPNSQYIQDLDPEWTKTVADRVLENTKSPTVGGRKSTRKSGRKSGRKTTRKSGRKNRK